MDWNQLKEEAKKMGYIVSNNGYTIISNDPDVYIYTMFYSKDGVINVKHYDKVCFVADHRTPDQMLAIMKALQ